MDWGSAQIQQSGAQCSPVSFLLLYLLCLSLFSHSPNGLLNLCMPAIDRPPRHFAFDAPRDHCCSCRQRDDVLAAASATAPLTCVSSDEFVSICQSSAATFNWAFSSISTVQQHLYGNTWATHTLPLFSPFCKFLSCWTLNNNYQSDSMTYWLVHIIFKVDKNCTPFQFNDAVIGSAGLGVCAANLSRILHSTSAYKRNCPEWQCVHHFSLCIINYLICIALFDRH